MDDDDWAVRTPWYRTMRSRRTDEPHRTATPLELLFDLCFVVAVSEAAGGLHHALSRGEAGHGTSGYVLVFFAIWWAWMNFTWFASSFDVDDVPYRLTTLVQIGGGLVLAAGVDRAMTGDDFTVITIGYVIMRLALVSQWVRVWRSDPEYGATALRFAVGICLVQVGWVLRLALPDEWFLAGFVVLGLADLAVPVWAERSGQTRWHPRHIAERYGLFTVIMLGESVFSVVTAVRAGLDAGAQSRTLIGVAVAGVLILFSLWWVYFDQPTHYRLTELGPSFRWGYGHYLIFAASAAVGAGLAVVVDHDLGAAHIGPTVTALTVTVPVAVYLLAVRLLHLGRQRSRLAGAALPVAAVVVLGCTFTPAPVLLVAAVMVVVVAL